VGDAAWRDLLSQHDRAVRNELDRFRGREIATTGDGFVALFDGAERAIRAAQEICRAASELGIEVRAAVHTGEIELEGDNVRGVAVHIATRIADCTRSRDCRRNAASTWWTPARRGSWPGQLTRPTSRLT